ncbi:hypothetical protein [Rhizobium tumorigenes]|uniref:hypothetical protein n=1 Tax=Rhizobium tumorigenes TaxID=2041385 RepID=UPI00241C0D85|nr:hypothetical protein [Rhizobium tumorigenes]WFS02186.1 hypothetical protein PR016_06120 [Rhizobium tumorigenes]
MIPLSENPAVFDPMRTLNANQREAVSSIAFFRHQRVEGGTWTIGPKRFSKRTIDVLERWQLVREERNKTLSLTTAGKLVADKLKGPSHGNA